MKGTSIGEFEELVLLTVGILYDDAYGLSITDELESRTRRNLTISSVHKALVRLEAKGFLKSVMGDSSPQRGGRAKKLYYLTDAGKSVVQRSKELRDQMWHAVPKIVWEGGKA